MILDDIADMLSSAGHGEVGVDLFKSTLPSSPTEIVALLHYDAGEPIRTMASSAGQAQAERDRVQVLVRSARYDAAMKRARDIWFTLDGAARTINGVEYRWISAIQSPFGGGDDEAGRPVVVCNYEAIHDPATSS